MRMTLHRLFLIMIGEQKRSSAMLRKGEKRGMITESFKEERRMNRNESFAAPQVNTLNVRLAWASLEMIVDDVTEMQILVSGDEHDVTDLKITCADGKLLVEQPTYGLSMKLNTERWMQLFIRVPKSWKGAVNASTISGMVNARGLTGTDLTLETVSGDLRTMGMNAIDLNLKTATGDIQAQNLTCDKLSLRSVSGQVKVQDVDVRQVKTINVSGETTLEFVAPFEKIDGNTVSGNIRLYAPIDMADAALSSLNGRVRTSGVALQEGAPEIRISSISGDLEIQNNASTEEE